MTDRWRWDIANLPHAVRSAPAELGFCPVCYSAVPIIVMTAHLDTHPPPVAGGCPWCRIGTPSPDTHQCERCGHVAHRPMQPPRDDGVHETPGP